MLCIASRRNEGERLAEILGGGQDPHEVKCMAGGCVPMLGGVVDKYGQKQKTIDMNIGGRLQNWSKRADCDRPPFLKAKTDARCEYE